MISLVLELTSFAGQCDEVRPLCSECKRRGAVCVYAASSATTMGPESPAQSSRSNSTPVLTGLQPNSQTAESLPSIFGSEAFLGLQRSPLSLFGAKSWVFDMEMMHHYSTVTADTLTRRADMQHVWRIIVPELGYKHPFVLHGLLAITATHKAYLLPSQRDKYLDIAAYHQTLGLEGFRTALFYIGDDNWKPSFCFSSTIVLYVCSLLAHKAAESDTISEVLKLFVLIRGFRSILLPCQAEVAATQLAPLSHGIWIVDQHGCDLE